MAHSSTGSKTHVIIPEPPPRKPNQPSTKEEDKPPSQPSTKGEDESEEKLFQEEEEHSQSDISSTSTPPRESPHYNYVKSRVGTTEKYSLASLGLSTRGTCYECHVKNYTTQKQENAT